MPDSPPIVASATELPSQFFVLLPHPQHDRACPPDCSLTVSIHAVAGEGWRLDYQLRGDLTALRLPAPQATVPQDGLWQHTCFELFVACEDVAQADASPAYLEFNFSPGGAWAAYRFQRYREADDGWSAALRDALRPQIALQRSPQCLSLSVRLPAAAIPLTPASRVRLAVSAVLEHVDGHCSYWALHHPSPRPDFHHPDAFVLHASGAAAHNCLWTLRT